MIEKLKEALYEIRGIIFEKAQAHTITLDELNRFNRAAESAFKITEAIEIYFERTITEETEFHRIKDTMVEGNEKLVLLLKISGMTQWGIERMVAYPVKFLKTILKILESKDIPVKGDLWFSAIEHVYRWVQLMVDRDLMNIKSGVLHKKLYQSEYEEVRKKALQSMRQITIESPHMINYIGKLFPISKLTEISEDYWYGKLSTDHLIGQN